MNKNIFFLTFIFSVFLFSCKKEDPANNNNNPPPNNGTPTPDLALPVVEQANCNGIPVLKYLQKNSAGTLFGISYLGIFRSDDEGDSWSLLSNTGLGGNGSFKISPNGSFFIGDYSAGVSKSSDGGVTFNPVNYTFPEQSTSSFFIEITSTGKIFVQVANQNQKKLFVSFDDGDSFAELTNLPAFTNFWYIKAGNNGSIFIYDFIDLYRSIDNGANWQLIKNNPSGFGEPFESTTGTILVSNGTGGIDRSTDGGSNWSTISFVWLTYFYEDDNGDFLGRKITQNGADFYRSTNNGTTWSALSQIHSPDFLNIIPTANRIAGINAFGFGFLTRSTAKWTVAHLPNIGLKYTDIAFASDGAYVLGDNYKRLYISNDKGKTWTTSNPLPDSVNCIAIEPASQHRILVGGYGEFGFTDGKYFILDNTADNILKMGTFSYNGTHYQYSANQVLWRENGGIFFGLGKDDYSGGALLESADETTSWTEHFLDGVGENCVNGIGEDGAGRLYVGAHIYYNSFASDNHFYTTYDNMQTWVAIEELDSLPDAWPRTITHNAGKTNMLLYWDNVMRYSTNTTIGWGVLTTPAIYQGIRSAKFDPEGYLWFCTGQGLFRSVNTF